MRNVSASEFCEPTCNTRRRRGHPFAQFGAAEAEGRARIVSGQGAL